MSNLFLRQTISGLQYVTFYKIYIFGYMDYLTLYLWSKFLCPLLLSELTKNDQADKGYPV